MQDKAMEILRRLNEAADESEYGRYIGIEDLKRIIREVMFGKPNTNFQQGWKTSWGRTYRVVRRVEEPLTDEQRKTIYKVCHRMLDKGIIKLSESQKMIAPTMTAEEWSRKENR